MKALLNSTNFWASGYTKWTVHRFFCSTYPHQMELQLKTTNLFFHMLLNPTGGCFSYLACFQPMAAELTIFRNGCKACKRLPLHVLTSQKKIESIFLWWKAQVFRYTKAPHVCFSTAAMAFLPFQSARGFIFRSPKARFWMGTCGETQCFCQGQVFFVKLASCIAVFGGAWHACNSPIEGGTEW